MIEGSPMFKAQSLLVELGVNTLIARNCSESSENAIQLRSDQCLQRCLEILKMKQLDLGGILGNPDLKWLLNTKEFQTMLPELQEAAR